MELIWEIIWRIGGGGNQNFHISAHDGASVGWLSHVGWLAHVHNKVYVSPHISSNNNQSESFSHAKFNTYNNQPN